MVSGYYVVNLIFQSIYVIVCLLIVDCSATWKMEDYYIKHAKESKDSEVEEQSKEEEDDTLRP